MDSPVARYRVGEFDVAILSDGFINLDAGALMGVVPRVMWESTLGSKNVDAENRTRLALNCMVVRRGDDERLLAAEEVRRDVALVEIPQFPALILARMVVPGVEPAVLLCCHLRITRHFAF